MGDASLLSNTCFAGTGTKLSRSFFFLFPIPSPSSSGYVTPVGSYVCSNVIKEYSESEKVFFFVLYKQESVAFRILFAIFFLNKFHLFFSFPVFVMENVSRPAGTYSVRIMEKKRERKWKKKAEKKMRKMYEIENL